MAPLSHPAVRDGWFYEVSAQWPGQAMTLKVRKILHVEKSQYQDILVFESETYGNVLVLDGVIQCTERDEFSYQEMIAHIPLASHPNPEKVLVIGGGDGGVVREVLKHSSVKSVVLCDIDEAVVRASRQFLPHMSSLLGDPRVTVHTGDGFKFLAENTSIYDVIITDSSDPVGPAESLFQKPYFELLHGALAAGGHMSTQAECLWLHLSLIKDLVTTARTIFPVVEYAFTTIPSYPSGQIGFLICSKEGGRDLKKPFRTVKPTRYYNEWVHRAAFVLPEFGRSLLEDGVYVRPGFGASLQSTKPPKKILLLGSGFVAKPAAEYLARDPSNHITVACRTLKTAQDFIVGLPNATAISLDVSDTPALEAAVATHDLAISLVPYTYHAAVVEAGIKGKTNVLTTSYVSPAIRALESAVKAAGIVVMNEIGLDPGIDHLYAIKTIDEVHAKGGKVKEFYMCGCGLPAPECAENPLGYKFSWSVRGGLLSLLNDSAYLQDGKQVDVAGQDLMAHITPYAYSPAYNLMTYPNRNSVPFREFYGIPEAQTVKRSSARYQGFPEFILVLLKLGWMDAGVKEWLTGEMTWAEVTQRAMGAATADESSLVARIRELCDFPNEAEASRIVSGLRWMGLFSQDQITPAHGNLFDTLCSRLEGLMPYESGERDLVILQHRFVVEWQDGRTETITSTLEEYGHPFGHSAMARLVGLPCGIASQLILDGVISTPGVHAPYTQAICDPIRTILESEGIGMVERVL